MHEMTFISLECTDQPPFEFTGRRILGLSDNIRFLPDDDARTAMMNFADALPDGIQEAKFEYRVELYETQEGGYVEYKRIIFADVLNLREARELDRSDTRERLESANRVITLHLAGIGPEGALNVQESKFGRL